LLCNEFFAFSFGLLPPRKCATIGALEERMNLDIRISTKRAVSVYGLNRFPFTLYADEWKPVLEASDSILGFILSQHSRLSCRCAADIRALSWPAAVICRGELWCRRSEKGAVSLYGLRRRFPLTLYCDQWIRVLAGRRQLEEFIKQHTAELEWKGCGVPRRQSKSEARPARTILGPDNIIRPLRNEL
jgi:hypothetical protein